MNEFIHNHAILIEISAIILTSFVVSWVILNIFHRVVPRLEKASRFLLASLLKSLYAPALILIWSLCLSTVIPLIFGVNNGESDFILSFREFVILLIIFWFAMRYISSIEGEMLVRPLSGNNPILRDKTNIRAIAQVLRITLIVVVALALLQTVGLKITTLLAFGGAGAIAVSFAAKDTLNNLFGGLMIYWDRPFSVGDWIRSPDRNIEGTVENIGWRLTRLRTFDQRPLYIPNGIFSTIAIENPQRMNNRRIKKVIGLRYQDAGKVKDILSDIENMLKTHPEIDTSRYLMVNLTDFGPSSLNFFVYTFTKTTNWAKFQAIQQDVLLKIIDIVINRGAGFAFPTTTLHIEDKQIFQNTDNSEDK